MTVLAPCLAVVLVVAAGHRLAPAPLRVVGAAWVAGSPYQGRGGARTVLQWVVGGLVALVSGMLLGWVFTAVGVAVAWVAARHRRGAAARRHRAAVRRALPDLVDLFHVAASAGHPVPAALAAVTPRAPDVLAGPVRAAGARFERGLPLSTCLADLGTELGPAAWSLTVALSQSASSGVPLVPLLDGVAAAARDERRRSAQEAARRLPVTMLFPLVLCVLPAAIALAVVPVLVVSVASLSP